MSQSIPFSELKTALSNWKNTFEGFINNKTGSLPESAFTFEGNDLGALFNTTVKPHSGENDIAKKLEFQLKKNLLVAADIYTLRNKKDEYLPDYLTDEFAVTCRNIEKILTELEQEF
jgi:hypothetical protein